MKKCKKCPRQISIMEEYCSECLKNLSLGEKLIEALRKEHFFKSGSTNRSFGNFCEYQFKGNYNRCCNFPNSDFVRTSLNNNIMPNLRGELHSIEQLKLSQEQLR